MHHHKAARGLLPALAVSVTAVFAAALPGSAATEVNIGFSQPQKSHYGAGAEKFKEVVEAGTGGRYTVTMHPASSLGGERDMLEGLQIGTIQAAIVSSGTLPNFVPEVGVIDIPFLFRDLDHARQVLDGPVGTGLREKFDGTGLKALAWGEQGFRHVTNSRNAIHSPADIQGLKIRTMENPVHLEAFKTLGAAPTPMAWPEVIVGLQQHTIDGQENPIAVITASHLSEVQKYLTLTGHVYSPAMLFVSEMTWDGMTPEDQKVFQDAANQARDAMRAYVNNIEKTGLEQLKSEGMEISELSPAEREAFREQLKPAYANYAKTFGQDLIDEITNSK